jgi:hypothetical protein
MPKLEVIYNSNPFTGGCSHCHDTFTIPADTTEADRHRRLVGEFEKHIRAKHPELLKQDASQAAARIVREATEE